MTEAMAMAILGVAAGLEVVAWSELAKDMVAGHMRTISYLGGERDVVYSADGLEPILGEAAARILETNLNAVLKVAEGVFKEAYVVEGSKGEIVGRLVLVLAMHACCREQHVHSGHNVYSHPVRLQVFLSKLCGIELKAGGLLCFNRFIMLNKKDITSRHLLICFILSVAIIPKRGQEVFDVLFPLLMPGPDGEYELREDRMQGLPVQIRNRHGYSVDTALLAKSARQYAMRSEEGKNKSSEHSGKASEKNDARVQRFNAGSEKGKDESPEKNDAEDVSGSEDDPSDPEQEDDDDEVVEPKQKKQHFVLEKETELKGPIAIYMHLGGKNESKTHELNEDDVLILHRMQFPFLKVEDQKCLDKLRLAFFKIEDHLNPKEAKIVLRNLSNYFMPLKLEGLTKRDLEGLGFPLPATGVKKDLVDLEGLDRDLFLELLPVQAPEHDLRIVPAGADEKSRANELHLQ